MYVVCVMNSFDLQNLRLSIHYTPYYTLIITLIITLIRALHSLLHSGRECNASVMSYTIQLV